MLGKNRLPIAAGMAFICGCLLAASAAAAADAAATLSVVNPAVEIAGYKIKRVTVTLDGTRVADCDAERSPGGDVCLKPMAIPPGPHVLELTLDPLKSQFFRKTLKFNAGAHGAWTYDIGKSALPDARESDYFSVEERLAESEGCLPAVERVAALSSCRMTGLGEAARALNQAVAACHDGGPDDAQGAIRAALSAIVDNHFELDIAQCYGAADLRKLPPRLRERWLPPAAWPPNTLTTSSWIWARDVLPDIPDNSDLPTVLDKMRGAFLEMARRFEVVDGVVTAALSKEPPVVLTQAMARPWSLDPTTPEGHRNILLLSDPKRFADDAYGDFVAARVAADASLDCHRSYWEAELLTRYFLYRETLTPAVWKAVTAMAERVPPDSDYGICKRAFDLRLAGSVPPYEHLRPLIEFDCSAARSTERRGRWVKSLLSEGPAVGGPDAPLRDKIGAEFAACLGAAK